MEKAIVSTDVGDVDKYIIEGETRYVVDVDDHEALAKRILQLVESDEEQICIGREARRMAQRHLDVGIAAEKHKDCYVSVSALGNKIVD